MHWPFTGQAFQHEQMNLALFIATDLSLLLILSAQADRHEFNASAGREIRK